jgi:hypothetical protein
LRKKQNVECWQFRTTVVRPLAYRSHHSAIC